jgi:hypothetical protein
MSATYNLNTSAQATLNASGIGQCQVQPPGQERWHVTRIAVITNQDPSLTTIPICSIYTDSVADGNLFDATFTGSQDSTDADLILERNQPLIARWTGGISGTNGTMSVFGTREVL